MLLAPHFDDETLFAAYTILRVKPLVVTVCSDAEAQLKYDITQPIRQAEKSKALWWLGDPPWTELGFSDQHPDWAGVLKQLEILAATVKPETVYAPLWEEGGHEHHNRVADLAWSLFPGRVKWYSTYRRGEGRSQAGRLVEPESGHPARKFRAMACYRSQINLPSTRPWFGEGWDREFLS